MPRERARLYATKVLPEPGLAEVTAMTEAWPVSGVMNSRLVRTTRKASLMMSRLCGFTTMRGSASLRSPLLPRRRKVLPEFFLPVWGISPTNGAARFSISLRPRTTVLSISFSTIITRGIAIPITAATSRIIVRAGAVGAEEPSGVRITRVL